MAAALAELRRRGLVVTDGAAAPVSARPAPVGAPSRADDRSRGRARRLAAATPTRELLPDLVAALARCAPPVRLYGEPAEVLPALERLAFEQLGGVREDAASCAWSAAQWTGLERVLQASLRPGDRVAVEDPGYAALFDLLRARD